MEEKINENPVTPQLDFKEIISLNIGFLQAFGNYRPEVLGVGKGLYLVYAVIFVGTMFVVQLTSELVNMTMVVTMGDMEKVTEASFLTLTHVVQVAKFYYLYKYQNRVKALVATINRKEFQPKNFFQYTSLKTYVRNSKIITKIFLSACVMTCSFWGLYPFTMEDLVLPLAGWFPFDTSQSPMFEVVYAYQILATTLNGLSNISLDTFMSGFIYLGMLTSEVVNMILVSGDMEKTIEASFLTLTHLVEICKVYTVIRYRNRLKQLLQNVNRKEFRPKNMTQTRALQKYIQNSKMISKVFLTACVVTCSFWGVYPYVDNGDLRLPLSGWFPFNTRYSPWFEVAYVYQVFGSTVNGLVNVSLDTFMSGLIMVVCAQLNILNNSLQNMRELAEIELRDLGIEVRHHMTVELQEKMNEKLLECVTHHQCIIEFAKELTFLFTTSILGQFIVSVVIICITLFEITLLPVMSIKFFSLILYQFCMLLEIFLLCYYGNEVIRESSELTKFAFCSDWMDCSPEFKRNLVFFMTRSQMALKLYAGGFFTLSLETFVKILKSSWSYFAVLNSVHTEE